MVRSQHASRQGCCRKMPATAGKVLTQAEDTRTGDEERSEPRCAPNRVRLGDGRSLRPPNRESRGGPTDATRGLAKVPAGGGFARSPAVLQRLAGSRCRNGSPCCGQILGLVGGWALSSVKRSCERGKHTQQPTGRQSGRVQRDRSSPRSRSAQGAVHFRIAPFPGSPSLEVPRPLDQQTEDTAGKVNR